MADGQKTDRPVELFVLRARSRSGRGDAAVLENRALAAGQLVGLRDLLVGLAEKFAGECAAAPIGTCKQKIISFARHVLAMLLPPWPSSRRR